jgi:4-diphosphocytidyl-2-C-methyl-D-erythritol kinase
MAEQLLLEAPAKINLALDVLKRREDGFHEVEIVFQSIDLADRLLLQKQPSGIHLETDHPDLPAGPDNLAYRAARLLLKGRPDGIKISLDKDIPIAAGLAGGSTDAAAALVGINQLLRLRVSWSELGNLAVRLGADVPFCLRGGTALATGIGDQLQVLPSPPNFWVVLVNPPFGVTAAAAYQGLAVGQIANRPDIPGLIEAIRKQDLAKMAACMGNVLESVVTSRYPELESIRADLLACGALGAQMSGSGPTMFGIFAAESAASQAAATLADQYRRTPECAGRRVFVTKNRQEGIVVRRSNGWNRKG